MATKKEKESLVDIAGQFKRDTEVVKECLEKSNESEECAVKADDLANGLNLLFSKARAAGDEETAASPEREKEVKGILGEMSLDLFEIRQKADDALRYWQGGESVLRNSKGIMKFSNSDLAGAIKEQLDIERGILRAGRGCDVSCLRVSQSFYARLKEWYGNAHCKDLLRLKLVSNDPDMSSIGWYLDGIRVVCDMKLFGETKTLKCMYE